MKILLDMNIPLNIAKLLSEGSLNVALWFDVGTPRTLDTEIMTFAHEN